MQQEIRSQGFSTETYPDPLVSLEKIIKKLKAVNKLLVVEIGLSEASNESNELVISADGNLAAFSDVLEVVKMAPEFDGWEVRAFRQRKDIANITLKHTNGVLSADKLRFTYFRDLYKNSDLVNLNIYIDGVPEVNDEIKTAVFLFLDSSIGEFKVGTKIGRIGMGLSSEYKAHPIESPIMPLTELEKVIEGR